MSFFADLRMLLEQGALEVTTRAKNHIAIKTIVFADGDVISLADPDLVTPALSQAHLKSVNATISKTMLGANGLAKFFNYAAAALGLLVFVLNFSEDSFPGNILPLALTCVAGGALIHVVFGMLGRRLFNRIV